MTSFDSRVTKVIEWAISEGLRDDVNIGLLHGAAAMFFDPPDRKAAVLECVRRILADRLMVISSLVGDEYVPYEAEVEDLVEMVETNFPYEDDGETYREDYIFLYWFTNTQKGDEKARGLT